ncbi:MAG TPA: MarR family transcriptional regulator [Geodermatophilus sp.]|nr:MarR family transcriptional regulator [Geodermatophilus sp.]
MSARNITALVDGLEAAGLVSREPHPADRRATLVRFTADGARTAEALEAGHRELADVLFAGMPDERFDCFLAGMAEVLARLQERLAPSADAGAGR